MLERYISIRQAMVIIGLSSRSAFDRRLKEWGVKKYYFGRSVRIRLSDIQNKIENSRAS